MAFSETDAAGIVHFSVFFRYMEDCEHAFVRSLGGSVHVPRPEGGFYGFPRVQASCEYLAPLRFEDEITVRLGVLRKGTRSITWTFEVVREPDAVLCARGSTTAVCTVHDESGMRAAPLPALFDGVVAAGQD